MIEAERLEKTLTMTEEVLRILSAHGVDAVLIGAAALAVHGYPRATEDLDLAISTEPASLHRFAEQLRDRGYQVEVRDPDPDDPLGGVIDVVHPGAAPVQVVNFNNPPGGGFPRLVTDAVAHSLELTQGRTLRVVDLPHLLAFKLYAGGAKSKLDALELLARNPTLDRVKLRALCDNYRLTRALDGLFALERDDT